MHHLVVLFIEATQTGADPEDGVRVRA